MLPARAPEGWDILIAQPLPEAALIGYPPCSGTAPRLPQMPQQAGSRFEGLGGRRAECNDTDMNALLLRSMA